MARVRAILAAVWTATKRNRASLGSFSSNNLIYAGLTLFFLKDTPAFVFFLVIMGVVLFFPLSNDPMRAVPRDRLALWPLANRERRLLRMLSMFLNPLVWLLPILLLWKRASIGLWALTIGLFAVGFVLPSLPIASGLSLRRGLPSLPGPLRQLIRKDLRQMLSTLDFYCGLVLIVPAAFMRLGGLLPLDARLPLTLIVVLAISTRSQSLFGLDGEGGLTRYRLLPLAGWQVLAAKDAAFLLIALALTLPVSPLAGLAAAFTVLATGHHASVVNWREQTRWRFQTAASFGGSLIQILLMTLAAAATWYTSSLVLAAAAGAYLISTWWCGRVLDNHSLWL